MGVVGVDLVAWCPTGGGRRWWTCDRAGFLVEFRFDDEGQAVVGEGRGWLGGGPDEMAW